MHLLCPHCHSPIECASLGTDADITCPECGSGFHLAGTTTTGWAPLTGKRFGKFEVLAEVGKGGCGTVYKARDPELDRVVAVKVPRTGSLSETHDIERFLREARSAAQLSHPAIVQIHEVGLCDGVPYLVSDFVEGVTLADRLTAGRLGHQEAAELIAAVADALQYAHDRGVVHRDIKPSNIMLELRIVDCGILQPINPQSTIRNPQLSRSSTSVWPSGMRVRSP